MASSSPIMARPQHHDPGIRVAPPPDGMPRFVGDVREFGDLPALSLSGWQLAAAGPQVRRRLVRFRRRHSAARLVRSARAARATVLYCHGNGGNVAYWADAARSLHDRVGVSVMLFDYRGYGRSEGKPSEAGVLADARAARAWLAKRAGIAENQIVLMGRSLGGGVAVDLAAADGARALVLESTFTSMPDVARRCFRLLPVRLLMQTQFNSAREDRQLSRPAAAEPRHGRPADSLSHRPPAVRRRQRAEAVRPHPRRRPQRSANRGILSGVVSVSRAFGMSFPG